MTKHQQKSAGQDVKSQACELEDTQLDQAEGGIIAVLIGLARDTKHVGGVNVALADGSVRS